MIGNPHQILHDIQNQALFDVQATRLTNTTDPAFGQGNLAQMETHMTQLLPTQSNELFTRMYVSPVNPYPQTPIGTYNNHATYEEVIANTQQASYQLTVANDNNLWAFKTLAAPNSQAMNILIKELPAHQNFIANSDPAGGAVGVKVNSNGDAAALQNYLATTKPYDFSWRSAMGAWADGTSRPNNIANLPGVGGTVGNDEAGFVFFNWVMGSNDVQNYQNNLKNQSKDSGNEAFGVLTWDSLQNKYVMLSASDVNANSNSISGTLPTLGENQTAFFGMHTHEGDSLPSQQDLKMTDELGLDQVVIGGKNNAAIFTTESSNNWQGKKFEFEGAYHDSISGAGYGPGAHANDTKGVGGVSSGQPDYGTGGVYQVGGNSGNSIDGLELDDNGHVVGGSLVGNSDYQMHVIAAWVDRYTFKFGGALVRGAYNSIFSKPKPDKIPDKPKGSLKVADDSYLSKNGVDPHTVKGEVNEGSTRNIAIDRDGNLWSVDRHGSGNPSYLGHVSDFK